ncbi:uracil permease [Microdochium trichocladiopsis]|uniref:Uracil permease n=1 Tax=Microdochium trichocladiopsis TaxID=1682393 RepID=A0A9P8XWD4_9PEZI|nr:uracil permease [Microdochium trichocladiopsis]KAH7024449.1 uracil permease [Microdochium trichocladiopsis]
MASVARRVKEAAALKADPTRHEETTTWCNRDLVPLPPSRRTWGWFNFFGAQSLGALNISTWQTPNTFLTQGLSVGQAMLIIVISRFIVSLFACIIAWCGLTWHIGFTVQNRFTWGLRGAYIPLMQRCLLNFIWTAVQCWNGGKLVNVCVTAIWPSFGKMKNTLPPSMPTTTPEMVGFIIFWVVSLPFLFVRPERYKKPFFISSLGCGIAMFCMMIWSLSVAKGVGPVFYKGEAVPASSRWSVSWLIMAGLNQAIGQKVAGITNESDFSRYGHGYRGFVIGTVSVQWIVGIFVCLGGLVTTAACQLIYGKIFWNPPDLLMVIMDNGDGSSGARAGVFFLALAFAFAILFQNVCGNAVAGGIDLAGVFPRYIDIRRGAIITLVATWVIQPWQLINRAATFITVLSSFSVFLAPLLGVMIADYFFIRRQKIKLGELYRAEGSDYWFTHGFNLRVIPCWVAGWAPTIGGLVASAGGITSAPDAVFQLYYTAFFTGLAISFTTFYVVTFFFPVAGAGEFDPYDDWATFTPAEAARLGVVPHVDAEEVARTGFGASGYSKRGGGGAQVLGEKDVESVAGDNVAQVAPQTITG